MNPSRRKRDLVLATGWPVDRVRRCLRTRDRNGLVSFVRQRHTERFFQPIQQLRRAKENAQGYGFAMMALCSLLIETIQSYREGLPTTYSAELTRCKQMRRVPKPYRIPQRTTISGVSAFRRFFQHFRVEFDGLSGTEFYRKIRSGLLHQAQTKGGWRLTANRARLWETKTIDRNLFADQLEMAFERHLAELTRADWTSVIWLNTRRKIWWLIRLS
jgi:hypothetical protein